MAISKKNFNTSAILKQIYPAVSSAMDKNMVGWKRCMSNFISKRSAVLFDTMPCDRIYYSDMDRDELFTALKLNRNELGQYLKDTYYWNINPFKPAQAKDITTIVILCIVRYFVLKKNDQKSLELALIYQAFSGKYYPSIHYGSFPTVAPSKYRHVMEYVVNNKLSNKYDLKTCGTVIATMKSSSTTWVNSYADMIKSFEDEDITYVIQQLHNRIKSFMKNIAELYYEAYENRDYLTYDKDDLGAEDGGGGYHLTDNDSFKLQKYVENTMTRINTSQVDLKTCKSCADANVKKDEISAIIEAILNNKDNIPIIKEMITIIIATYLRDSNDKDVVSLAFLNYCIKPKPNTKDEKLIRLKEILNNLLDDNSVGYRKRKKREATKNSYHKAVLTYFSITIINANK